MVQPSATDSFNARLLAFIQRSPSPFHAVAQMAERLRENGFTALAEGEHWSLKPGGRYYVTRNDSSIIAFVYGRQSLAERGIRLVGAHTDSPCLKVKPSPERHQHGCFQLGVEVYGGALLAPWFDRDLSLAGRVTCRDGEGRLYSRLLDFEAPIATVPSLAIHLDREANRSRSINPQKELPPLLAFLPESGDKPNFRALLASTLGLDTDSAVLDYDLCFYDTQAPAQIGLQRELLASARLDNLLSCFVGLEALINADGEQSCLLVCNDHEEVGSASACGARGPMLGQFLQRLVPDTEARLRMLDKSLLISADNAHALHPNFADRHDENHGPRLNGGPVIKVNANQRYATTSETSGFFRWLCESRSVPVQAFVTRTDMECGSTIGPITASEVGVKTLDVGVPTYAMHSIRELAGDKDAWYLNQVLDAFYDYSDALTF
ncbi:M18 family aminopeptidase [Marinimicrobium alkaliphilum]|uniref:M18 family aminopeptidase n=1 Tax=Marinimicrobium alkaliphilum TaxID=2202654 RepID=UPI000DB975B1|nr:M18 family aminopeptidase [Marinimicrobium alkaliphilum]